MSSALAQSLEKEGDTKKAFSAYHQIIRNFPATPSGTKAAARIKKCKPMQCGGPRVSGSREHREKSRRLGFLVSDPRASASIRGRIDLLLLLKWPRIRGGPSRRIVIAVATLNSGDSFGVVANLGPSQPAHKLPDSRCGGGYRDPAEAQPEHDSPVAFPIIRKSFATPIGSIEGDSGLFGDIAEVGDHGADKRDPRLRRMASACRSGSPGIRGPEVPGAGLAARKTRIPLVDLALELVRDR